MTSDTKYSPCGRTCIFEACAFIHVWDLLVHLNVNAFNKHSGNIHKTIHANVEGARDGLNAGDSERDHGFAKLHITQQLPASLRYLKLVAELICHLPVHTLQFYFTSVKSLNQFYVQDHKVAPADSGLVFLPWNSAL